MDRVACIVIGAGVVGLAIAHALARQGRETIILEEGASIGGQTSSRNNEVIHAGFLYPPGSLKARLCRTGRDALYAYCDAHGVAYKRIGKLVIATSYEETVALQSLAAYAAPNGVHDLEFLDGETAREREPNLRCHAAVSSPSTGVVDSHGLMIALLGDAESAGAAIAYGSHVDWVKAGADAVVVGATCDGAREYELECSLLINAAGLDAARIAGTALGRPAPEIALAKGNFFSFTGKLPFQRLVVPVGGTLALGGAFTIDIGGQGKFGPDLEWVDTIDYAVDPTRLPRFLEAIRRYYPAIAPDSLQPDYSGIRPRSARGESMADWVVEGPQQHGAPNVINLLGVDTPGLTACLSIADHVAAMAQLMERDHASMPNS